MPKVPVGQALETDLALPVTFDRRALLSGHHLLGAAYFSRQANKIEEDGKKHKSAGRLEEADTSAQQVRWCAIAAVLMSTAAVEAQFQEISDNQRVPETCRDVIWKTKGQLQKHNCYLEFLGHKALAVDQGVAQAFDVLVSLRNSLTHFSPEWENESKRHRKLANKLKARFALSPLKPEDLPIFPGRCFSHSCAAWAVETAWAYADAFTGRLNVASNFQSYAELLKTE